MSSNLNPDAVKALRSWPMPIDDGLSVRVVLLDDVLALCGPVQPSWATAPQEAENPPAGVIAIACEQAAFSPCRSKRGAVVFSQAKVGVVIHGRGHNRKPEWFNCDGSAECKASCRIEAVHAEQKALLNAGCSANGADLVHVKVVDRALVESGGPSCVECSKLALAAGIAGVWLYHGLGWKRYKTAEFHALSLAARLTPEASSAPAQETKEKS